MTMQAFRLKGQVSMALYSGGSTFENRPLKRVGNVSEMTFSFSEEEASLLNYRNAAGGLDASIKRISDVSGTLSLRHFTADNLARLIWGTNTAQAATPVVDEAGYKIVTGAFVPTKALIDTTVAPTVKKGATTILTADYTVSPAGILIADTITTGSVASGDSITISYTPKLSARVDALISAAPDVSIHFEGINEVDNKYLSVKFWKCKLGAAQNVSLIGDDFGALEVSFSVQSDDTVVTSGFSKYGQILIQE